METDRGEPFPGVRLRPLRSKTNGAKYSSSVPNSDTSNKEKFPEEPVSPAGRLFQEPMMNNVIICTLGFKEKSDLAKVREVLSDGLLRHYRFRSRVVSSDTIFLYLTLLGNY